MQVDCATNLHLRELFHEYIEENLGCDRMEEFFPQIICSIDSGFFSFIKEEIRVFFFLFGTPWKKASLPHRSIFSVILSDLMS